MSYFKRFLIFALSALLIVAQPVAYAASPVGWATTPADVIMNGASATITAIKGSGSSALQSTIKHAPAAGRIAKHIVKVGAVGAIALAIPQLIGDGVDYVLDPANNRVKYKVALGDGTGAGVNGQAWVVGTPSNRPVYPTADAAGRAACRAIHNTDFDGFFGGNTSNFNRVAKDNRGNGCGDVWNIYGTSQQFPPFDPSIPTHEDKYVSYSQVADKIRSNAAAGDVPSQELIKTIAIEDLESGALDTPLNIVAVPKADAPPVTDPNAPPIDPNAPPVPFDPSSIISAIKSVMSAITNMAGILGAKIDALMVEMGLQNAETNRVINDGMADVVAANNATGARVGDVVAAIEALEGNTLDGKVINDAIDRAIAAGNTDTASIVAAIEAIEGNTLDGQVINDAVDRVIANDNVNAQSAAEAKTAADAAQAAADVANTAAVTDAIDAAAAEAKEAADAKAAADAAALEWAKEAPEAPTDTGVIVDEPISDFDSDKSYITFTGSCPPKYTASLSIMGATAPFEFDYTPICTVMSYLKPFIVGAGYIAAAYIIAGHSRGSKD